MTEQVPPIGSDEHEESATGMSGAPTTTGVPAVDRVLAQVDELDDLPLEEHLGAFERAHESLRGALDAQPGDAPTDQPGDPA
jgi:hypothetical protein